MVTIPELRVPGEGGDDPGEALEADGVGAGQQLGVVLGRVVVAEAGAARQEGLVEVIVVYGDRLHKRAAQIHSEKIKHINRLDRLCLFCVDVCCVVGCRVGQTISLYLSNLAHILAIHPSNPLTSTLPLPISSI